MIFQLIIRKTWGCNPIDTNDIIDIHKYLMKKT